MSKPNQDYYWTPEWQQGEKESREEIGAGRAITFKDVGDAIRWLRMDDEPSVPPYPCPVCMMRGCWLCAPKGEP